MTEKVPVFLIYHDSQSDAAGIELEVRRRKCAVERASKPSEILELLASKPPTCLILNLTKLDPNVLLFGAKVRTVSKNVVTLALHKVHDPKIDEQLRGFSNFISMPKPLKNGSLGFLCEKIIQGQTIKQRQHTRFPADQNGTMNKMGAAEKFPARVLNLSKGGAYIEYAEIELKPQDVIKISIPLDKISKVRTVSARVLWVAEGIGAKHSGAGIEFMNDDEAYLSLLEKT
jgi:hypothetical protein